MTPSPHALYIHIPFCTTKCTYCAFNTYTHLETLIPAFVDALVNELKIAAGEQPNTPLATVFVGGGTPSLLTLEQHARILSTIRSHFDLDTGAEISIETNPNDLDLTYLSGLRHEGYNRLSVGMQSANERELAAVCAPARSRGRHAGLAADPAGRLRQRQSRLDLWVAVSNP
ncbi:MAG: radical SAM protein [Chloroflexi bacterium]|nr:radical SAM protein [Chloroflexota bacterium]